MSRLQHAAVLYGPKDLRLETRPIHAPQEGQVQVAVVSTGLCGSDHHYYTHGRNGDFALKAPLVLGHEAGGVVTAIGPGVSGFKVGQRVAIEPGIPCSSSSHAKKCRYCLDGRYNLCNNMRFCSSAKTFPHLDGTLQGFMNHPADRLFPLPEACTFDQAALAEPLSVVMHASRRANFVQGQSVVVFGVGAIGALACALAKAQGASRVCAIDINPARLDFVKSRGFADETMCLPRGGGGAGGAPVEDPIKRAAKTANAALAHFDEAGGFDVVYECSGAEPCIQMGIYCARPGGKLCLVGMGTPNLNMPLGAAALREVDVVGVFRYHDTWPAALSLLASGRLDGIEDLISHRLPLHRAREAFELVSKGVDADGNLVLKVLVSSQTTATRTRDEDRPFQRAAPPTERAIMNACHME
ncbi:GroES-like protein [Exidia glandulosa HHB12029]|uniref:GroES-like protein n=1 Tax=Exidia glandulosa HHB12029 TaxID=1314781 RepID=A0A165K3J6_EXIGL|nr:GroES-like protein [Exidia glandulosa HHB12029]